METFRFWFNRRRHWVDVYLHDVTPTTFDRRGGGRWGYYVASLYPRNRGRFGELHIVKRRVREDVIAHELFHLLADWLKFRKVELNDRNEEKIALWMDEFTRSFWREYKKLQ